MGPFAFPPTIRQSLRSAASVRAADWRCRFFLTKRPARPSLTYDNDNCAWLWKHRAAVTDIQTVLIANRGEIALRVIRACRELEIATVAVYSDADRAAPHVAAADRAYRLGPAPSVNSYLRGDLILEIAHRSGAQAIHPGYGFLSENADFSDACERAGIKFIGPSGRAMRTLGSKTLARQAADELGLPRVPGSTSSLRDLVDALHVASQIGYPVMLKAAAGGGGKGMRPVFSEAGMGSAFDGATGEALRSFGSGEVYLEKLIERPRHIEIQILADEHGNCIHLGERECSVQRRHQKVIEEALSVVVNSDLRARMGETAVRLARSAGYANAGTVEFLVESKPDGTPGEFYFLEVNTRLQVEHPVTELVTGLDLVHLQIAIARGERLPLSQDQVSLRGHAIECRIYAEDPDNGFMPSPGKITRLLTPSGPGVREDSGIYEGWTVPMDYDPMLSKLIAYAPTRKLAIARALRALDDYVIGGIRTNLELFRRILRDPLFQRSEIDTGYLDRKLAERFVSEGGGDESDGISNEGIAALAAGFLVTHTAQNGKESSSSKEPAASQWKRQGRIEGVR
jgi:acetyl-CoA carboxylase biotin carboxylase subunit